MLRIEMKFGMLAIGVEGNALSTDEPTQRKKCFLVGGGAPLVFMLCYYMYPILCKVFYSDKAWVLSSV